jgi:enamine deaminase RidA (YjgF/YER057c/UK114 family)
MTHERLNPETLYRGSRGYYSQIVTSRGTTQWHIAGMVPLEVGRAVIGDGDMRAQSAQVMRNLGLALEALGITPAHVVRVHIFTTDMDLFLEEGRPIVYSFFGDTPPASTLVGVTRLADAKYLVEVEATAVSFD